ncbi:CUB and sushi domain-containing protein 3 [Trichonephila clavipes]|nr:CUB and sushi domain-containing protein 3 [Trichonephila clavipes]
MLNVNTIRRYAVACLCASFIGAVLSDCPIPEKHPNNGRMRFQYRRDVNLTIAPENYLLRFQCNEGYVLKGAKAIVCVSDEWTKEVPVCSKMSCADPPSIPNGDYLLHTGVSEEPVIGSEANYTCNDGYELKNNSNNVLTCHLFDDINDAQWKGEVPSCIGDSLLGCLHLKNPRSVHHCFQMVGFVINPKALEVLFSRHSKKRKIIIIAP